MTAASAPVEEMSIRLDELTPDLRAQLCALTKTQQMLLGWPTNLAVTCAALCLWNGVLSVARDNPGRTRVEILNDLVAQILTKYDLLGDHNGPETFLGIEDPPFGTGHLQ